MCEPGNAEPLSSPISVRFATVPAARGTDRSHSADIRRHRRSWLSTHMKMKDGQLFHVLTYGQNNMPFYASQLSREDRWNVILYVRTMQAAATPAPAPAASSTPQLKTAQTAAAKVSEGQP